MPRILCVLPLVLPALAAFAGPLDPPPGPVEPTMKTLDQIEPRECVNDLPGDATAIHVISEPGSYYLDDNIFGELNKDGIAVLHTATPVTIDLNGFRLDGSTGGNDGIEFRADPSPPLGSDYQVLLHNGSVVNWPANGIVLIDGVGTVRQVNASGCGGAGIIATGSYTFVACGASKNDSHGISATNASLEGCVAEDNGASGMSLNGATARGCVARSNAAHGFNALGGAIVDSRAGANQLDGFRCTNASLTACVAETNFRHGFHAETGGATLTGCVATGNQEDGFVFIEPSLATGCAATANVESGFRYQSASVMTQCRANGNGTIGFEGEAVGARIVDCVAKSNALIGFQVFSSHLSDCMAESNTTGFFLAGGIVKGCSAAFNSGDGFEDVGGSRITSCHAEVNGTGFRLTPGGGTFFAGNTATLNTTSYDLPTGNTVGAVVDLTASDTITTANQYVNIEY